MDASCHPDQVVDIVCSLIFSWQSKCLAYFVSPGSVGGRGWGVKNRRFCSQRIRAKIVHLVERPTEKPGATPTWVRIPGAARIFFPRVHFQCRLSYGVRTAPKCNRVHQHLCAR